MKEWSMSTLSNSLQNLSPRRPGRPEVGTSTRGEGPGLIDYRTEAAADEVLVADSRAGLSPSEMVERRLFSLLNGKPLPANASLTSAAHRYVRRT